MSTLPDVVDALRAGSNSSWAVADALAGLPDVDKHGPLTLDRISRHIYETTGDEWFPATLGAYRSTARAFPIEKRFSVHSFSVHFELRAHPEKLAKWKPTKARPVLTQEAAKALRGRSGVSKRQTEAWQADLRKALRTFDRCVEHDPIMVVELLETTLVQYRRRYSRQLKKAGSGLRAV